MPSHSVLVIALLAAACSSATGSAGVGASDALSDLAPETAGDAIADVVVDAAVDTVAVDTVADTIGEAKVDIALDVEADLSSDAASDTAADVAVDVAADGAGVQCSAGGDNTFPSFDTSCAKDADCFVAVHQINCCGTHVAWGLNASAQAAFAAAEATCVSQYPGCGCAEFETMAQDGYSSFDNSLFAARCEAGTCRSWMPTGKTDCQAQGGLASPKPVKTCATSADCAAVYKTVDCCGSQQVIGVANFAKAAYDKVLQSCNTQISLCDCVGKATTQEDSTALGSNTPTVSCLNGQCLTGVWPK